jgi:hypothetical protein
MSCSLLLRPSFDDPIIFCISGDSDLVTRLNMDLLAQNIVQKAGQLLDKVSDVIEEAKTQRRLSQQANSLYTIDELHIKLSTTGLQHPEGSSACARKAIQEGFFDLNKGLDQVVWTGECEKCKEDISCTLQQALNQPDYAGDDYKQGGLEGAIQCKSTTCPGLYLTGMCIGALKTTLGRGHNHCSQCPGLGQCWGDTRTVHCVTCGNHYYEGEQNYACDFCGSGSFRWGGDKGAYEVLR